MKRWIEEGRIKMIIINGDRCSGKTTKAINYVENHPKTILVVATQALADNIKKEYKVDVVGVGSLNDYHYIYKNKGAKYFIDDIERCFKGSIIGITTMGKIETYKHEFKTAEQLATAIQAMGIEKFKEYYPEWDL